MPTLEKELRDLKHAIDQTSIIAATDTRGRIQYANKKFCELSKYSLEELLNKDHRIINSGHHSKEMFQDLWQTISSGKIWRGEIKNKAKDGTFYWVDTTIVPFLDDQGRPERYFSIRTDITEKVQARENFEAEKASRTHMQKLESLGTLAGGVAHDFNNILQGIWMGLENVSKKTEDPEIIETLDDLINLSVRGKEMIKQILAFSRKIPDKMAPYPLLKLLSELDSMMSFSLPNHIALTFNKPEEDIYIKAEPTQLLQVFINLCTNAAYAMRKSGGSIEVQVTSHQDGNTLISVQDNGPGIPKHLHDRIFEPFFTTKPTGEGTGMGLSVVHGIIQRHQGSIQLKSSPQGGARFDIILPVCPKDEHLQPTPTKKASPTTLSGRLLLVDDDVMIQKFGSRMFEDMGLDVQVAEGGAEALEIFNQRKGEFDLVITDFSMPSMNGIELLNKIRTLSQVPALLATGNPNDEEIKCQSLDHFEGVVQKPFSKGEIMEKIAQVLQERPKISD